MPQSDAVNSAAVTLRDLRFAWPRASAPVLAIESFTIERGQRVFLCGPSGSGKSTLLGVIGGVLQPGGGEVGVLGTDLGRLSPAARDRFRADHIGLVFQQFNLLPYLGVVDNVLLATRFSARRAAAVGGNAARAARELLAVLGLDDTRLLHAPVTELSVGQQQRVAVARALLGAPGLVIADEPTSALDSDSRAAFMELLFRECARTGATLLFVSHDRALADGFDRVVELPALNRAPVAT
jgi:putative ABC transport system ATP-binding protein